MDLQAKTRTILGKKVKSLRKEGLIPAELYGQGIENKHLSIPKKGFTKIYKEAGEHTIINLLIEGGEKIPVLISHAETHSTKDHFLTIDFHQVKMDELISTHVPVEFTGESPGVKSGFMLVKVLEELEVEALPTSIPHAIEVSIEKLENPGDTIRISDITIPKDAKIHTDPETVIASLSELEEEEELPVAEESTEETDVAEGEKAEEATEAQDEKTTEPKEKEGSKD